MGGQSSIFLVLAASLLVPFAAADETKADCEPGQLWVGWLSTKPVKDAYDGAGRPGGADACEGEHWDGQDTVAPYEDPVTTGCAVVTASGEELHAARCLGRDPNAGPHEGPAEVATMRASAKMGVGRVEAYGAANILFVGRVGVYGGACHVDGAGLEGQTACGGTARERVALYFRDNTPGNFLMILVNSIGLTRPYVSEGDCTYAQHEYASHHPWERWGCGRDNTAITLESLLP